MFKRPTVFVLGAGASHPYGFPLGSGLRDLVLDWERTRRRERVIWSTPAGLAEDLGLEREYAEFLRKLQMSGYPSVDQFLERNPAFTDVGKMAIAAALMPCERSARLFPPHAPRRDHWFEVFANMLHVGERNYLRNKVTILTYNYDRSLEQYLGHVMMARISEASSALGRHENHIPIIHLHGQLGGLGMIVDTARGIVPYGLGPLRETVDAMRIAMREISVVHNVNPATAAFKAARQALDEAERIYFLGFGYNPTNLDRLQIFRKRWTPEQRRKCIVRGTSLGLSKRDWQTTCARALGGAMQATPRYRQGIAAFLRNAVEVD